MFLGSGFVTFFTEGFVAVKLAIESFNHPIPRVEAGGWDDGYEMVCLHGALGEQGFANGAQVQLARASRLGVDAVFDIRCFDAFIFYRPLGAAQGRHDEGVFTAT